MDTMTFADALPERLLCRLDDIPDGGATAVDAVLTDGEDSIILLRRGDDVCAYLNICPHAGRRLDYAPGKFLLKNGTLICAVHGATFDVENGVCIAGPCRGELLRSVPLRVENGDIFLAS
ncbi:Rieske (2Fe-2S) protein [Rhodanobacter sp. L36]|uniref:Rieske (2Fe-2S) protein n=1 Tax=Rhodanobacter sp. L36 TaxID=1747221 RepID=UPI00131BB227|nr:Rieske (2Fe-2S) protein [Rhodanobacter sp. L36]